MGPVFSFQGAGPRDEGWPRCRRCCRPGVGGGERGGGRGLKGQGSPRPAPSAPHAPDARARRPAPRLAVPHLVGAAHAALASLGVPALGRKALVEDAEAAEGRVDAAQRLGARVLVALLRVDLGKGDLWGGGNLGGAGWVCLGVRARACVCVCVCVCGCVCVCDVNVNM